MGWGTPHTPAVVDAAERMAARRRAADAGVDPDLPAVRAEQVERLDPIPLERVHLALALLGIEDHATVRAVQIEGAQVTVVRGRPEAGIGSRERIVKDRRWITDGPEPLE